MTRAGWFCPACQRHHAPHVETCPAPVDLIGKEFMPNSPSRLWFDPWKAHDPCAGCKGPCGNAACPKRIQITSTGGSVTFPHDPLMTVRN